ncbi:PEP-CTERM sorting domain-containing protein [Nitrosomonas sp.]|uniref:PEP-CTERM sorting domain-containing protein n=1 Tax=Nitrosomonas sp. TaxID=42353 RepID=UPI00262FD8D1|nr:PEP-CTERM sorting domain-containing protein [Nitrosomonas sp.]
MNKARKYVLLSIIMTSLFVVTKSSYANSNFSAFSETMQTTQLRLPNVIIRDALHDIGITANSFKTVDSKSITNDYSSSATVFTGSGFLYGGSANYNVDINSNDNHVPDYLIPGILSVKKHFTVLMNNPRPADHGTLMTQQQPLLSSYHPDTAAAIPEPETHTLLLLGIALLGASVRRRHKNT